MMQPGEVHGRTEKDSRKATARRYVGVQNHRSRATPGLANWPGGGGEAPNLRAPKPSPREDGAAE